MAGKGKLDLGSVTITTAASVNVATDYKRLDFPGGSAQLARIGAAVNAVGGAAFLANFVLYDGTRVLAVRQATLTPTTMRSDGAGAGDYLCTVDFGGGSDILDLLGVGATRPDVQNSAAWYVGCPNAFPGAVTTCRIDAGYTTQS